MAVTSGAIRETARGLRGYASSLRHRASGEASVGDEVARQLEQLASAWRSPRGEALGDDGAELVRLHRRAADLLEQASAEVQRLAVRGEDLHRYVQSLERRVHEAEQRLHRATVEAGGFPSDPGVRERLWSAHNEHRAAESQLVCASNEWLSECESLARRLAVLESELAGVRVPAAFGRAEAEAFATVVAGWTQGHRGGFGSTGPRPGVDGGQVWFDLLVSTRLAHPQLSDEQVVRQAASQLASQLRADLEGQIRQGSFDAATIATVETLLRSDRTAAPLLEALGAEVVATFAYRIEVGRAADRTAPFVVHGEVSLAPELAVGADRLLTAFARGLSVATSSDDDWGAAFAAKLAGALDEPGAAYGLSVLLHRGGPMGGGFVRELSERVYEADRRLGAQAVEHWASRSRISPDSVAGAFGPPGAYDPMTGISVMLAHDVDAAQRFVLADDGGGVGERLEHLTVRRDWSSDAGAAFGGLVQVAAGSLRDYEGADAVRTATDRGDASALPEPDSPGWRSARIATQFLDQLPLDPTGRAVYDGMVLPAATLVAVYVEGVRASLRSDEIVDVWRPRPPSDELPAAMQAWEVRLDRERSRSLFYALGADDRAYTTLFTAAEELAGIRIDAAARDTRSEGRDVAAELEGAIDDVAPLLAGIVRSNQLQRIEAAASADRRVRITAAAAAGVVAGTAGAVAGPFTATAMGASAVAAAEAVEGSQLGRAEANAFSVAEAVADNLKHRTESALLRHGHHGEAALAGLRTADGGLPAWDDLTADEQVVLQDWLDRERNETLATEIDRHLGVEESGAPTGTGVNSGPG